MGARSMQRRTNLRGARRDPGWPLHPSWCAAPGAFHVLATAQPVWPSSPGEPRPCRASSPPASPSMSATGPASSVTSPPASTCRRCSQGPNGPRPIRVLHRDLGETARRDPGAPGPGGRIAGRTVQARPGQTRLTWSPAPVRRRQQPLSKDGLTPPPCRRDHADPGMCRAGGPGRLVPRPQCDPQRLARWWRAQAHSWVVHKDPRAVRCRVIEKENLHGNFPG